MGLESGKGFSFRISVQLFNFLCDYLPLLPETHGRLNHGILVLKLLAMSFREKLLVSSLVRDFG